MADVITDSALYKSVLLSYNNKNIDKLGEIANKFKDATKIKDIIYFKFLCLIEGGKFSDALNLVTHNPHLKNLKYEKAYCHYRLNHLKECLKILLAMKDTDIKEQELLSQIYYKMDDFEKCLKVYMELLKSTQDDYDEERVSNLLACLSQSHDKLLAQTFEDDASVRSNFEIYFNLACINLAEDKKEAAKLNLKKATDTCRKIFLQNDQDQDFEKEMTNIKAQIAYVDQISGKNAAAIQIYDELLNTALDESSPLHVIITNNKYIVDQKNMVAEYKKGIKKIGDHEVANKLSSQQLRDLTLNQAIFAFRTNQFDLCKNAIKSYQQRFNEPNIRLILLNVALLCKDKNYDAALQSIQEYQAKAKAGKIERELVLVKAQILYVKGDLPEVVETLLTLPTLYDYPEVLQYLVALYVKMGSEEKCGTLYLQWLQHYRETKEIDSDAYKILLDKLVNFLLKPNTAEKDFAQKVIPILEEYAKDNPLEKSFQILLIRLLVKYDKDKAMKLCDKLSQGTEVQNDDGNLAEVGLEDELELAKKMFSYKRRKSKAVANKKGELQDARNTMDVLVSQSTSRRNKNSALRRKQRQSAKRVAQIKAKRPESFVGDYSKNAIGLDPERWLPKQHKSSRPGYYRRKAGPGGTNKKGNTVDGPGRGTQGAILIDDNTSQSTVTGNSNASNATAPQTKPQNLPSKIKKKKKGGRW